MGLFSRHGSRSASSSLSRESSFHKKPGLDPLPTVTREDGRGHSLASSTKYYDIGVSGDWNYPNRRTMEDASVVVVDYMGIPGCAFFAVYDGHAGAQCAQIASEHMHIILAEVLEAQGPVKDVALGLSEAFQRMDDQLRTMEVRNSGSTAVVAVSCFMTADNQIVAPNHDAARRLFVANVGDSRAVLGSVPSSSTSGGPGRGDADVPEADNEDSSSFKTVRDVDQYGAVEARRLSYDHRCSDINEQRRVSNAGGLVVNNRVNGMLAVTRSLGDLFMKDYVVGAPYTTETVIDETGKDFLIMACDGLYDVCNDETAVQIVDTIFKQPGKTAASASNDLLAQALQAFSMDNITVMVIKFTR